MLNLFFAPLARMGSTAPNFVMLSVRCSSSSSLCVRGLYAAGRRSLISTQTIFMGAGCADGLCRFGGAGIKMKERNTTNTVNVHRKIRPAPFHRSSGFRSFGSLSVRVAFQIGNVTCVFRDESDELFDELGYACRLKRYFRQQSSSSFSFHFRPRLTKMNFVRCVLQGFSNFFRRLFAAERRNSILAALEY